MPFALTIPTMRYAVPPMVPLKSVGVDPKSSPSTCCEAGTPQESARERLGICRASSASANGVPAAAYRTVREAMNDPQLAHRSAFSEVRDHGGSFRALNPPFRMSGSTACVGGHAPALGEHTRSVLRAAGFGDAEIDVLIECGGSR